MIEFQFIAPEGDAQDQKILLLTSKFLNFIYINIHKDSMNQLNINY